MLTPPGVKSPEASQGAFVAAAPHWRAPCEPAGNAVTLRKRRKRVRVIVDRDLLGKRPVGWLADWTAAAEAQGCLPQGTGLEFAMRILDSVPLNPAEAYRLLHSSSVVKGYTDLGLETQLQVVTPIYRDGADPNAPITQIGPTTGSDYSLWLTIHMPESAQYGVETAWYRFAPRADHNGATIVPISAERRIGSQTQQAAAPIANPFQFAPSAAFYRLYYKADLSENSVTEIIIGAPTRAELDRRTEQLRTDLSLCSQSDPELCMVIPRRVAVNPFLAVTVNGAEVRVPVNGTVRSAIAQGRGPRNPEEVLPQLAVWKPFAGQLRPVEFDRSKPDILNLTLLGGESISWVGYHK